MFLQVEVTHSAVVSDDDIRSLPTVHPDGSSTFGDEREDWLAVNRLIKDSDNLIDVE